MFEKIKVLKEAAGKLYQYFTPSRHNCARTIGLFSAIVLVPVANILLPMIFFRRDDNDSENKHSNIDLITAATSVSIVALLYGTQKGLSTMLATSTMQAIRERNVKLLMDAESKFLLHGDNTDIKSMQYITVGVGVRDFAINAVPMFIELPMCVMSSTSTLAYIGIITGSFTISSIVFGFATTSAVIMYLLNKGFSLYVSSNQKVENELVAKIAFIEAHRSAISLMEASDTECSLVLQSLHKVNLTIPKLSLLDFSYFFITSISRVVASQFLGDYYIDHSIKDLSTNKLHSLNVMIMNLLSNVANMIYILTNNYEYIKLNLEQLKAFDKAYNECVIIRNANNKMIQEFEGDRLTLLNFSIYKPATEDTQNKALITMLDKVTLELLPNKVYHLTAESGGGKTTFLKAITNNWQYTDGIVKLPLNAKNNMCFIPQDPFISPGTLLENLLYTLTAQKSLRNSYILEETIHSGTALLNNDNSNESFLTQVLTISSIIDKAKQLLSQTGLLPEVIKEEELGIKDIDWNQRLSGGEKQKIAIIRAILANPNFIIMDEATSALDVENKQIVYEIIKNFYITKSEKYIIIYTDHNPTAGFADAVLTINGQNLDYYELASPSL